jgi:hypothetical protein
LFQDSLDEFLSRCDGRDDIPKAPTMVVVSWRGCAPLPPQSTRLMIDPATGRKDPGRKSPDDNSRRNCDVFQQASSIAKIVRPLLIVFTVADSAPDPLEVSPSTGWNEYISQFMKLGYEFRGSVVDAAKFGFQRQQSHFRITFSKIGLPYTLSKRPHPSPSSSWVDV